MRCRIDRILWEAERSLENSHEYTGEDIMGDLLALAVRCGASDLHLTAGAPPVVRRHGRLWRLPELAKRGPFPARPEAGAFLWFGRICQIHLRVPTQKSLLTNPAWGVIFLSRTEQVFIL